jgi:protease IV
LVWFVSYGTVQEFRRHQEYFKASGKSLVAYLEGGGAKEYLVALGCDEVLTGAAESIM